MGDKPVKRPCSIIRQLKGNTENRIDYPNKTVGHLYLFVPRLNCFVGPDETGSKSSSRLAGTPVFALRPPCT
jgi:hypothetical protein